MVQVIEGGPAQEGNIVSVAVTINLASAVSGVSLEASLEGVPNATNAVAIVERINPGHEVVSAPVACGPAEGQVDLSFKGEVCEIETAATSTLGKGSVPPVRHSDRLPELGLKQVRVNRLNVGRNFDEPHVGKEPLEVAIKVGVRVDGWVELNFNGLVSEGSKILLEVPVKVKFKVPAETGVPIVGPVNCSGTCAGVFNV